MAIGATNSTHILTRGGFEKLEFSQTGPQQKIRLYHRRDLTVEKIKSARAAILEELHAKGRNFKGDIEAFEEKTPEKPYLLREGETLRLISYKEMTQYVNQAFVSADGQTAQARTCCKIGNTFLSLGHYQGALECYYWCLAFAKQQQDEGAEGSVYYNIANVFVSQEHYQHALTFYQKCLAIAENQRNQESLKRV